MFGFFKKSDPKVKFDRKILRKNDISLLTLDERWNNLFVTTEKPPEIIACELKVKELLKEQARLVTENKENSHTKRLCMDRIMKLTTEAFDKNNEQAKDEMQKCEKEIRRINERATSIEQELENIPDRIKEANLELLEYAVNLVYFKVRLDQKRVKELESLIEETKAKLKEYIDEKEQMSQDYTDVYTYFHDLLGPEELERLDKEFLK